MLLLFALLFVGLFLGILIRHKEKSKKVIEKLIMITIYFLLFSIGLKVGSNHEIVKNFHNIGFKAILFSFFAVAGSITLSFFTYKLFFKSKVDKNSENSVN